MNDGMNLLDPIIEAAKQNQIVESNDYIDGDGFLVCGKCHTRRECNMKNPFAEGYIKVPCLCNCRMSEREAEEKHEQIARTNESLATLRKRSLMDERFREATFDNFIQRKDNAKCYRLIKSYADRFDEMQQKSQGLMFYGNVGTGKTYAAACIANALLSKGVPVIMTSFVKLLDSMHDDENTRSSLSNRLNKASLLIIDDLGAERNTRFALERVYDVIDTRYRSRLPLILTTNLKLNDMLDEEDTNYARIYDRIFEMCIPIPFTGVSWRKIEAAKRNDKMTTFMEEQK